MSAQPDLFAASPRPVSPLTWVDATHWRCPSCGHQVLLDPEEGTRAEAEADPLCWVCRPSDDPRLSPRSRAANLARGRR